MMRVRIIAAVAAILIVGGPAIAAEADLSKLTCKQAAEMGPAVTGMVAAWASGYAHAKSNTTMVEVGNLSASIDKVKTACTATPDATVSSVIDGMK